MINKTTQRKKLFIACSLSALLLQGSNCDSGDIQVSFSNNENLSPSPDFSQWFKAFDAKWEACQEAITAFLKKRACLAKGESADSNDDEVEISEEDFEELKGFYKNAEKLFQEVKSEWDECKDEKERKNAETSYKNLATSFNRIKAAYENIAGEDDASSGDDSSESNKKKQGKRTISKKKAENDQNEERNQAYMGQLTTKLTHVSCCIQLPDENKPKFQGAQEHVSCILNKIQNLSRDDEGYFTDLAPYFKDSSDGNSMTLQSSQIIGVCLLPCEQFGKAALQPKDLLAEFSALIEDAPVGTEQKVHALVCKKLNDLMTLLEDGINRTNRPKEEMNKDSDEQEQQGEYLALTPGQRLSQFQTALNALVDSVKIKEGNEQEGNSYLENLKQDWEAFDRSVSMPWKILGIGGFSVDQEGALQPEREDSLSSLCKNPELVREKAKAAYDIQKNMDLGAELDKAKVIFTDCINKLCKDNGVYI